jgi:hypothetical protein
MFSDFDQALLDDPEFKEDSVREEIIVPILRRLGYRASGPSCIIRSKTLVHPYIYIGTRKHPVKIIPDYTLLHDNKTILILDAKSPSEDIQKKSHIQQAYSYAIHPEIRCKHFALCNGKQLAVFHADQSEPLLVIPFQDFERKWSDLEKYLSPRYLLKPELRIFSPDFGLKISRIGLTTDTEIVLLAVRLGLFSRLDDNFYTASVNCEFANEEHCVSFDFPNELLEPIISGLPTPLAKEFRQALSCAPFQASADLVIELDIKAKLGVLTKGQNESFIPLIIEEILASRFNPEPLDKEPNDIPSHIFRLRNAFKVTN